jgi:hypothetical protein
VDGNEEIPNYKSQIPKKRRDDYKKANIETGGPPDRWASFFVNPTKNQNDIPRTWPSHILKKNTI